MNKIVVSRIFIVVGIILSVGLVAAALMMMTGRLYIGLKEPSQDIAPAAKTICGEDIIKEYQSIVAAPNGYGPTALEGLVKKVSEHGGPVCHYIVLHDASLRNDRQRIDQIHQELINSMKMRQAVEPFYRLGISQDTVKALVEIGKADAGAGNKDGTSGQG
mgnify:CR=1 FL=1